MVSLGLRLDSAPLGFAVPWPGLAWGRFPLPVSEMDCE